MMAGSDRWDREAEELNGQIIELDPENFPALYRRGLCRIKVGEIAGAVEDLSKVVSLKPNVPLYERKLEEARGRLDNLQAAEERARVRKERRERMRRISNLESYSEAMEIARALRAPENPDLELAAAAFSRAWELEPGDPVAPTQLAQTYRSRGELHEALSTYQGVLKRHDSRFAKVGLAAVLCDLHRYAPAARLCASVLKEKPDDVPALHTAGRAFAGLDMDEKATRAFARAAEISTSAGNPVAKQSISGLNKLRDKYRRTRDTQMASWISSLLERLDADHN